MSIQKSEKIFIAGRRGMVGSAFAHTLEGRGFANLTKRNRSELDLSDSTAGANFFGKEKAEIVILAAAKVVESKGELSWDKTKPDGTPGKLLNLSKLRALGWALTVLLHDGIARTYDWFLRNIAK